MELTEEQKELFWSLGEKNGDCYLWTRPLSANGYGQISMNGIHWNSHRLSLYLKTGNNDGDVAKHLCRNKHCINPLHLEWGTYSENNGEDKYRDNTIAIGERHGKTTLTELQVREIREKYIPTKYSVRKLASEYNVGSSTISRILNNKTWTHI